MNRVSRAAQSVSETFISTILSAIGIISAIPELIGTATATGDPFLALAVAATGVGSVHVAVLKNVKWLWGVFAIHILFLEITLIVHHAWQEMTYPIFTAIGAVVMVQFMEYSREREERDRQAHEEREEEKEEKEFEREQKRMDRELTRELRAERERNKMGVRSVTQSVNQSVTCDASVPPSTSEELTVERRNMLQSMLHSGVTVNKAEMARKFGVSRQTIYRDMQAIEQGEER